MDEDKNIDEEQPIVEGEVVETPEEIKPQSESSSGGDQATVLLSLEQLIKSHIASIDRLKDEVRKHKDMLDDSLLNDAVYQEHDKAAKEAVKIKSATRSQILKQPQNSMLANKVKNMSSELKDKKSALSDYLLEYQRMSGVNEIEGEDGEVREIVNSAKVIKKATVK